MKAIVFEKKIYILKQTDLCIKVTCSRLLFLWNLIKTNSIKFFDELKSAHGNVTFWPSFPRISASEKKLIFSFGFLK